MHHGIHDKVIHSKEKMASTLFKHIFSQKDSVWSNNVVINMKIVGIVFVCVYYILHTCSRNLSRT